MDVEETIGQREKRSRRRRLLALIRAILSGQVDSRKVPLNSVYQPPEQTTRVYFNSNDRDSNNYGYTEIGEMLAGNPNEK